MRGLGKAVGVCVLQYRHVWSSFFTNKKLKVCQEHKDISRLDALLQLVVKRIT